MGLLPWPGILGRRLPFRGQTIRLVKDAVVTMEGGYRKLLRGGR
jgi:hypothetical protein